MHKIISGILTGFLLSAVLSVAAEQLILPEAFQSGTPIRASEMNQRFSTLYNALNSLEAVFTTHKHTGGDITSGTVQNAQKLNGLESSAFSQEGSTHRLHVYSNINSSDSSDYGPEVYRITGGPFTCNASTRGTIYIAPIMGTGQDGLCACMYNSYFSGGYVHICFNP
ncbi:MAG: hypothetical protein HQL93_11420 [Magnetococcales bacterium]|nr:hypothetical protein [Magnetococcales bacterium]